jgi:hypothetical protein
VLDLPRRLRPGITGGTSMPDEGFDLATTASPAAGFLAVLRRCKREESPERAQDWLELPKA